MSYRNAIDIANRALDHCGQDPIDATLGFDEASKKARICARVYDKLRQAELRRNVWRFAIRRAALRALDTDTMLLVPALWVATTTYFVGSIVADADGGAWISLTPDNLDNHPQESLTWAEYFGPMSVMLYSDETSYHSGELVYTTDGDGTARTYLSLQSANEDDPSTATAWDATVTYSKNQVVTFTAVPYMSRIDLNTAQTPTASALDWAVATVYGLGDFVTGTDGIRYQSLIAGNLGNDPVSDGGVNWLDTGILTPWTSVFTGGTGSVKWRQIGGAEFPMGVGLSTMNLVYPIGAGPSSQSNTRNVFRLPAGFLRQAPTEPKAGATSYLGAAWGLAYTDWNFEGLWITSSQSDPIMLRFVADTVDVTGFDPMFCEMLGARIGLEVCEPLTQSSDKLETISSIYALFGGEARTVNGIETGSVEPPVDDYLMCRY